MKKLLATFALSLASTAHAGLIDVPTMPLNDLNSFWEADLPHAFTIAPFDLHFSLGAATWNIDQHTEAEDFGPGLVAPQQVLDDLNATLAAPGPYMLTLGDDVVSQFRIDRDTSGAVTASTGATAYIRSNLPLGEKPVMMATVGFTLAGEFGYVEIVRFYASRLPEPATLVLTALAALLYLAGRVTQLGSSN